MSSIGALCLLTWRTVMNLSAELHDAVKAAVPRTLELAKLYRLDRSAAKQGFRDLKKSIKTRVGSAPSTSLLREVGQVVEGSTKKARSDSRKAVRELATRIVNG